MQNLLRGVSVFQKDHFGPNRELFERLAEGQSPRALFVTCSDSRVDPNLITQASPGELFVLRNAGNIVPPYGTSGGEDATVEYAMRGLGIERVVVCGHSGCGAMGALLKQERLDGLPAVKSWIGHAGSARRAVDDGEGGGKDPLELVVEANVLVQMENLLTHPSVAERYEAGEVRLYGWVYKIGTGEVLGWDEGRELFLPLSESPPLGEEDGG